LGILDVLEGSPAPNPVDPMTYSAKALPRLALVAATLTLACSEPAPDPEAGGSGPGLPADHPSGLSDGGANPGALAMTGVVEETLAAAGYTYVRLTVAGGERWIAGPPAKLEIGDTIAVSGLMYMGKFESDGLGRTFDELYFTDAFGKPGRSPSAGVPGHTGGMSRLAPSADAEDAPLVQADVTQILQAGIFVYLEVESEGMRQWLAAPTLEVTEGQTVAWRGGSLMLDFKSPSLGRTFERVLFVQEVTVVE